MQNRPVTFSVDCCPSDNMAGVTDDGKKIAFGSDESPSPMQLLEAALGGCAVMTLISAVQKMDLPVARVRAELSSETREKAPSVFTSIHVHFVVMGYSLSEARVARAVEIADKYCPVHQTLAKSVKLTTSFEIEEYSGEDEG